MSALTTAANLLGGQQALARIARVTPAAVSQWSAARVPTDRCPSIERATAGQVTCEALRPDVRWVRVSDPDWPHADGRPCIDVAAPVEVHDAAA